MKGFVVSLLASVAAAHYQFPALILGGQPTTPFQYVRKTTNWQSNGPVTDITSNQIRCYELQVGVGAPDTGSVAAGGTIGFVANPTVTHPGPMLFYMAKVPAGKTAATWDATNAQWFKIFQAGPTFSGGQITWPDMNAAAVSVTIPQNTPSGDYLLRIEHIALHAAGSAGGAQFYLSCGQITVTGGGNGTPGPLVSFPGAYKATDPGILINIYYPVPTSYTFPGPAVWTG